MSVLSVFNQTVTELLPSRKAAPTETDLAGDFGRELKDADARLDRPQPADDQPRAKTAVDKSNTTNDTSTATQKTEPSREARPSENNGADSGEPTDAADPSDVATAEAPVDSAGRPAQNETTQVTAEAATPAVSITQLIEQVLTAVSGEPNNQSGQAVSSADVSTAQAAEQAAAAGNTGNVAARPTTDQASTPVPAAIQPPQDKAAQSTESAGTRQSEPSASAQRIAVVSEARKDSGQQTTGDDAGQQHSALKSDARAQVSAPTAQAPGTAFIATTAPVDVAGTGAQTFTAVDSTGTATAASAQPGQAAPIQDADNTELNTARIARGLQNAVQQKGGAVTLRLTPPQMGTVRIQLQIHNGTVNAQFHAETESTRTLLNQQMSHLRTALEQQGLSVERLGVQTMQNTSGSNLQHESQSDRDGQANDGRSRGGFTQQGNRQGQRPDTNDQQAFEKELGHAA